ncbi:hypothetical protein BDF22DRAFT_736512, partial [Syncephalis plumigaleata]
MSSEQDWVTLGVTEGWRPCRIHWEVYNCKDEKALWNIALTNACISMVSIALGFITLCLHWMFRLRLIWSAAEMFTVYAVLFQITRLIFVVMILAGLGQNQVTLMNFGYAFPILFLIIALLTYGRT